MSELIIDSFAGGGGASTGIELALGRSPDIAINHDAVALAMHEVNHPDTVHLPADIWHVDPLQATGGRPVGLLWASPDCKHFSKAKGGKPVEKNIRSLAWVVVHWAQTVSPRVIILENVEEFATWGPLAADGRPCPQRKGVTFKRWLGELKRLGYAVEWHELRACDYGAPTIRKRLFLIARRDGRPIVWPEPTHGDPKSPAVQAGKLKPWRTAAEIIDWSLPCPSIFATSEEIFAEYGIRAVRPLAGATMARIAKGVKRYVIDAAKPFIVPVKSWGGGGNGPRSVDEPLRTTTASKRGEQAVVAPFISAAQQGGSVRAADLPLHTVAASPKDQNQVVVPTLIQTGYGERPGQSPRVPGLEKPLGTAVDGVKHALVSSFVTKFNSGATGHAASDPLHTITSAHSETHPGGSSTFGVVAAHLMKNNFGDKPASGADEPAHTVTTQKNRFHLVTAFLAQHNYLEPGHDAREPLSTIVGKGSTQGLAAVNLLRQFGTGTGSAVDEPARTVMADGMGKTQLSAAFLQKYYGVDQDPRLEEPLHTATTKDRFGLATVTIEGEPYIITDIGMRMLTPRELFGAQGFPADYVIERRSDGTAISKTDQVRMCGNSVSPPMAAALVAANVPELAQQRAAA